MNDRITSHLRTLVPYAWALLLGWLAQQGAPQLLADALGQVPEEVLIWVVAAAVYSVFRVVEPYLPGWLVRVLLGSARQPSYGAPDGQ